MRNVPCIVLTGGPGGGKTTLIRQLRAQDPQARRWLLVPEAAPLLFQVGLNGRDRRFQRAVVRLQIALEQSCREAACSGQVLLCHRGTLDPLAYWLRNGWQEQEFFALMDMNQEEHFQRYAGVMHLQMAAIGAEMYYHRWPDAHRPETVAQAAELDRLCVHAWCKHPCYILIENAGRTWEKKVQVAYAVLSNWLVQIDQGGTNDVAAPD